jgi:hypothetical protein
MNNKLYIFADGDGIGSLVGTYVLKDDVNAFIKQSKLIREGNRLLADWISSANGEVYNNEGDEIVGHIDPSRVKDLENIRQKYYETTGSSISIGLGNSLSQAGKALIAAKLTGKDKIVTYQPEIEDVINEAHQAVQAGTADDEQQKMDDHYIHAIAEDQQAPIDEEMPQDEDSEFYEESPEDMMQLPEGMEDSLPEDEMVDEDVVPDGEIPMDDDEYQDQYDEYQDQYDEYQDQYDRYQDQYDRYQDQYDEYQDQYDEYQDQNNEDAESDGEFLVDLNEDQSDIEEDFMTEDEQSEPSEFEQEPTIALEGEDVLDENQEDLNAEKADPEMATEEDSIDADLADADVNEDILQRIAANLDAFKQNKELMDQIKEAKPELYASMLGLLHNMIELSKMISPDAVSPEQEEEMIDVPSGNIPQQQQLEQQLPKQNG